MIHHYNHETLVVLVLFTVFFYQFLFSRYLELTERHFSSNILVPFPDSGVLYSRGTYWLFSFYSDNWLKLAIFLQKLAIFNICHFAPFVKLRGCRFLYFFSLCDVRNEVVLLLLEHSSPRRVKQKKHVKKREILAFKSLLQEIQLKNLPTRKIFWSPNI